MQILEQQYWLFMKFKTNNLSLEKESKDTLHRKKMKEKLFLGLK